MFLGRIFDLVKAYDSLSISQELVASNAGNILNLKGLPAEN